MKYQITPNASAKHGYDFVVLNDSGASTRIELTRKTTDGYLHIPAEYQDVLNRKLIKISDFEGKGVYEVTRREGAARSPKSSDSSPKSSDLMTKAEKYLTADELEILRGFIAKIDKEVAKEALRAEIAANQAKLAELESLS